MDIEKMNFYGSQGVYIGKASFGGTVLYKIGKSKNVGDRMDQLRRQFPNFQMMRIYELKTLEFEKFLHLYFDDYRVDLRKRFKEAKYSVPKSLLDDKGKARYSGRYLAGVTEWFELESDNIINEIDKFSIFIATEAVRDYEDKKHLYDFEGASKEVAEKIYKITSILKGMKDEELSRLDQELSLLTVEDVQNRMKMVLKDKDYDKHKILSAVKNKQLIPYIENPSKRKGYSFTPEVVQNFVIRNTRTLSDWIEIEKEKDEIIERLKRELEVKESKRELS